MNKLYGSNRCHRRNSLDDAATPLWRRFRRLRCAAEARPVLLCLMPRERLSFAAHAAPGRNGDGILAAFWQSFGTISRIDSGSRALDTPGCAGEFPILSTCPMRRRSRSSARHSNSCPPYPPLATHRATRRSCRRWTAGSPRAPWSNGRWCKARRRPRRVRPRLGEPSTSGGRARLTRAK